MLRTGCLAICAAAFVAALGQQIADTSYNPPVAKPAYGQSKGPRVAIDEAHFNFHTLSGRYQSFGQLLRRDGYSVEASAAPFAEESLRGIRILVIANALGERNKDEKDWSLPRQSAFTATEIAAVVRWLSGVL